MSMAEDPVVASTMAAGGLQACRVEDPVDGLAAAIMYFPTGVAMSTSGISLITNGSSGSQIIHGGR